MGLRVCIRCRSTEKINEPSNHSSEPSICSCSVDVIDQVCGIPEGKPVRVRHVMPR